MKTKSKTIHLIERLKRFFFLGGWMAGMTLAVSATEFYRINGNPASIHSADGEFTDNTVDYLWSTKPPDKTGLVRPSLITTPPFDTAGKPIANRVMPIPSHGPSHPDPLPLADPARGRSENQSPSKPNP